MKTINQLLLKAIMIGAFSLFTNFSKAQAWSHPITNSLTCDIVICYEAADFNCIICDNCPSGGITIAAGQTWSITGPNCHDLPMTDVHVVIISVDGVAVTGCSGVGDASFTCINSCGGTAITGIIIAAPSNCGNVNITYTSTGTTIW